MDFKELIEGWIVRALSTEIQPCKESHHFNITYGLYTDILGVIEEKGHNVEKTMIKVLKMLHPHVNLPSRISSLTRKVKRYHGDPHTTIHGTTPEVKDDYLGPSCRQAQLKISDLTELNDNFHIRHEHITNGLIYELEKYQQSKRLPTKFAMKWTNNFFPIQSKHSMKEFTHSCAWASIYNQVTKQKHKVKKVKTNIEVEEQIIAGFLMQPFRILEVRKDSRDQLIDAMENPPLLKIVSDPQPLLAMAEYQGGVMGKYVKQTEQKLKHRSGKIHNLNKKVMAMSAEKEALEEQLDDKAHLLQEANKAKEKITTSYVNVKSKVKELKTKYKPKNVKRREETKVKQIAQLKEANLSMQKL